MSEVELLQGDCVEVLQTLPDQSVNCCVTSPPYFELRDYGTASWKGGDPNCEHYIAGDGEPGDTNAGLKQQTNKGSMRKAKDICPHCGAIRIDNQIGLEQSPKEYVEKLVAVFREVKRVLKDDGVLWLNLGDSFVSGIIESQEYILRDDLTAEELEYVYSELAKHFEAQSKAVSDLWEANAPTEQEVSELLCPRKGAA